MCASPIGALADSSTVGAPGRCTSRSYPRRPTLEESHAMLHGSIVNPCNQVLLPPVSAMAPLSPGCPQLSYRPEIGTDLTKDPKIGSPALRRRLTEMSEALAPVAS